MNIRCLAVLLSAICCYAGCSDNGADLWGFRAQPVVAILSPKPDTTYPATLDSIPIVIGVSSEVPVSKVALFIDSLPVREFLSPPYSHVWNIRSMTGTRQHVVVATAQTQFGVMGISPSLRMTIADPEPAASAVFRSPSADSVAAVDSIYLEVTAGSPAEDSLLRTVQIYVDYKVIRELTSPPFGFTWVFRGLQDMSTHLIYAKVYDWRNRMGNVPSKKIYVRITPRVVYTPYLTIGNKWFYTYHSTTLTCWFDTVQHCSTTYDRAFVVRQVIDTTSDGWRIVSVRTTRADSVSTSGEYWTNLDGNIYVNLQPVNALDVFNLHPRYLSSLTHDSTWGDGGWNNYIWKVSQMSWFGQTCKTESQTDYPILHNAARSETHLTAEGIGPVGDLGYFYMANWKLSYDTTAIVGAFLNGVLLGDSTNIVP